MRSTDGQRIFPDREQRGCKGHLFGQRQIPILLSLNTIQEAHKSLGKCSPVLQKTPLHLPPHYQSQGSAYSLGDKVSKLGAASISDGSSTHFQTSEPSWVSATRLLSRICCTLVVFSATALEDTTPPRPQPCIPKAFHDFYSRLGIGPFGSVSLPSPRKSLIALIYHYNCLPGPFSQVILSPPEAQTTTSPILLSPPKGHAHVTH